MDLVWTDWDDWFKFSTLFSVYYTDYSGVRHSLGTTKIGRFGLQPGTANQQREGVRYPAPPTQFSILSEEFFSLGQDPSYYEALTDIGEQFREEFLVAMRDLAFDPHLLHSARSHQSTRADIFTVQRSPPTIAPRPKKYQTAPCR
ncbi:hypothetical protein [Nocardia salmonicida]|uniref:hypothetical protein n=1 Tax=Nocardia salmonicida TaxID=53431 RepID=UPI0037AC8512